MKREQGERLKESKERDEKRARREVKREQGER